MRRELLLAGLARSSSEAPVRDRPPNEKRRRRWLAFVLIPAALVGAAATYALTSSPDRIVDGIACYAEARVDADTTVVSADGRDPVAVCGGLWANIGGPGQPPPMVACAFVSVVGVFPTEDPSICDTLGGDPLPAGYEQAAGRFASMSDDLIQRFSQIQCVSEAEGRSIVREVLEAHGFTDWTIHVGDFSETQPCAELGFESGLQQVDLVASPG